VVDEEPRAAQLGLEIEGELSQARDLGHLLLVHGFENADLGQQLVDLPLLQA
jgi:hypothetical protein